MNLHINIFRCLRELVRKCWIIVIAVMAMIIIGTLMYQQSVKEVSYYASASVYSVIYGDYDEAAALQNVARAYSFLATGRAVAKRAELKLDGRYQWEQIQKMIETSGDSTAMGVINITAYAKSRDDAIDLANAVAEGYVVEVRNVSGSANIRMLDKAVSAKRNGVGEKSRMKTLAIYALIGLILSAAGIVAYTIYSPYINGIEQCSMGGKLDVNVRFLLECIDSAINGTTHTWDKNSIDINKVLEMAGAGMILPLIYPVLKLIATNEDIEKLVRNQCIRQLVIYEEIRKILAEVNKEGLRFVIFKGPVLAQLYPQFLTRISSDTDILVEESQIAQAEKLLKELGYEKNEEHSKQSVLVYALANRHVVELHTRLWEDYNGKTISLLEAMKIDSIDTLRVTNCCGINLTTLGVNEQLIYLIFHMVKHFSFMGTDLKSLVDIALYVDYYIDEIDVDALWDRLRILEYDVFAINMFDICHKYFNMTERIYSNKYMIDKGIGESELRYENVDALIERMYQLGFLYDGENDTTVASSIAYQSWFDKDRRCGKIRTFICFLFPGCNNLSHRYMYEKEVKELGGRIYKTPGFNPLKLMKYREFCKTFFNKHEEYKIIHGHNGAMAAYPLYYAKQANVPVRIAHSHNTKINLDAKWLIKNMARYKLRTVATHYYGCSTEAVGFYFGDGVLNSGNYTYIRNAIEPERFSYSLLVRERIRNQMGWDNHLIIGHVGRFMHQKNHNFLLDIFAELVKLRPEALLVLLGDGELMDGIRNKAGKLGIRDHVRFMGSVSNVNEYYQAFDALIMPSFNEGLPVVGIEAQVSNLPMVLADTITKEVKLTECVEFESLKSSPKIWADRVVKLIERIERKDNYAIITAAGYNIATEAKRLTALYEGYMSEIKGILK